MKGVLRGVLALGCALGWAACEDEPESPKASTEAAEEKTAEPADRPRAYGNLQTQLDLWELAHLAEVDHHGTFIDFGTPARAKYSFGDWRSGWVDDESSGEDTFNYAEGKTGRLFVSLDEPVDRVVRMRLKPIGTKVVTLYVNGEAAASARFEGTEWGEYELEVPKAMWQNGENRLLFRFGGTAPFEGKDVAVAMAWVHLLPKASAELDPKQVSRPFFAGLRGEAEVGGVQRRVLAVRAPTRIRYHVQVPEQAKLGLGMGVSGVEGKTAKVRVTVRPEGGQAKTAYEGEAGDAWNDQVIDLADHAGKLVRIDLEAEGDLGAGQVVWSTPSLLVPKKTVPAPEKTAKNVVVLLIDTLRADKLKPYDADTRVQTPALNEVAEQGTVFLAAQAPENWTKPSVASVLTSLWPATHNTKTDGAKLPQKATMLSEVYQEAGFATGSFIANGYVSDRFGFDQGWDYYTNYIREKKSTKAENVFREAGDWVEKHKDQRFFAYVQTIDPHVPYDPPDEMLEKYYQGEYSGQVSPRRTPDQLADAKRNPPKITFTEEDEKYIEALHDGEISYHDVHLAKFIERLKKAGVYDDTIFVITSDHGEEFNDHGSWGHGHSVYQELLGVPYIVRFPGVVPAGKRVEQTVSTTSVFPTVLEATGVAVPESAEGQSLLGFVRGGHAPVPALAFSDFLDDRRVIRAGRWKQILRGTNLTLFDLKTDPGEQKELNRDKHPVATAYCTMMLGQFLGADDLKHWLSPDGPGAGRKLEREDAEMDETLREQLKQLGYAGDEPAAETN